MKKYFLLLISNIIYISILLPQTSPMPISPNQSSNIEFLNVETFKKKVMNYREGNNTWNYIGTKPCIIDFYADWCRPCRMLAPIIENLSQKYDGKIIFYKINIDKETELAALFQISSIPALLFVPLNNKQPIMSKGYLEAAQIEEMINQIFK